MAFEQISTGVWNADQVYMVAELLKRYLKSGEKIQGAGKSLWHDDQGFYF